MISIIGNLASPLSVKLYQQASSGSFFTWKEAGSNGMTFGGFSLFGSGGNTLGISLVGSTKLTIVSAAGTASGFTVVLNTFGLCVSASLGATLEANNGIKATGCSGAVNADGRTYVRIVGCSFEGLDNGGSGISNSEGSIVQLGATTTVSRYAYAFVCQNFGFFVDSNAATITGSQYYGCAMPSVTYT
jgi:hypothetical protein